MIGFAFAFIEFILNTTHGKDEKLNTHIARDQLRSFVSLQPIHLTIRWQMQSWVDSTLEEFFTATSLSHSIPVSGLLASNGMPNIFGLNLKHSMSSVQCCIAINSGEKALVSPEASLPFTASLYKRPVYKWYICTECDLRVTSLAAWKASTNVVVTTNLPLGLGIFLANSSLASLWYSRNFSMQLKIWGSCFMWFILGWILILW